jgi:hypothetical protein
VLISLTYACHGRTERTAKRAPSSWPPPSWIGRPVVLPSFCADGIGRCVPAIGLQYTGATVSGYAFLIGVCTSTCCDVESLRQPLSTCRWLEVQGPAASEQMPGACATPLGKRDDTFLRRKWLPATSRRATQPLDVWPI